jgi:superfamily II DNA or RNA helicase
MDYKKNPRDKGFREQLLNYFLANGQLEVKFAVPKSIDAQFAATDDRNMYHVKIGYFMYPDGTWTAFEGSFNESDGGLQYNTESTQVFQSWKSEDLARAEDVRTRVDADWSGSNEHIATFPLRAETLELIRRMSSDSRPRREGTPVLIPNPLLPKNPAPTPKLQYPPGIYEHQKAAIEKFLECRAGVLEMGTGTGKTYTALEIIRQLFGMGLVETIIVSTFGTNLLEQWSKEIERWQDSHAQAGYPTDVGSLRVYRHFDKHDESLRFAMSPKSSLIIVSREPERLKRLLRAESINFKKTLIVYDEVHGMGAQTLRAALTGLHSKIGYRLGLSATPDREYDSQGNDFISTEIGPIIFKFEIRDAILQGILCEFDYIPIWVEMTQEDKLAMKNVHAAAAQAQKDGRPWTEEKKYMELSKVVKKASLKPAALNKLIEERGKDILVSCILFVHDTDHGDQVTRVISNHTQSYRAYYSGVDSEFIDMLSTGRIDALVACERLNEGIDIRSLKTVILIASDRAKLNTIQRIGRCLRTDPRDPTKRAKVVDFLVRRSASDGGQTGDDARCEWLSELSQVKQEV